MTREDMLTMATVLEGHPDNVAPAIYGGLSVSIMADGKTLTNSIPIDDDLSFITVSPEVEVSTEEARKALPKTIDYQSAVFNVSRVSFLVSSLFTKQYDRIAYGLQDKLHVPTASASSPVVTGSSRRLSKPVPGRHHQRVRLDTHRLCHESGSTDHGCHDRLLQRPRHRRYGPHPEMQQ